MGIDADSPISTGLACSSTKKLLSNTHPTMLEKTVANTPSIVEAFKLVRSASLGILESGSVTRGIKGSVPDIDSGDP